MKWMLVLLAACSSVGVPSTDASVSDVSADASIDAGVDAPPDVAPPVQHGNGLGDDE